MSRNIILYPLFSFSYIKLFTFFLSSDLPVLFHVKCTSYRMLFGTLYLCLQVPQVGILSNPFRRSCDDLFHDHGLRENDCVVVLCFV